MPRITNDLHTALVEIAQFGECQASLIVFHKLELMGLIVYEFGGHWSITDEGRQYLSQVIPVELHPVIRQLQKL
ncbi:MAG: hypothetical protein C0490_12860 [Marivirga sp.]|jgi:Mn-dependent DtxR family transcriptional regulator|nr:hypothetical protein [Marivirga sp.]